MLCIKEKSLPTIGLFAIGLDAYWPQFPQMRGYLEGNYEILEAKYEGKCNLVSAGLVDSVEKAQQARQLFQRQDVDIIFCSCATYSPSSNMLPAVIGLGVTVVVLNLQPQKKLPLAQLDNFGDWLKDLTCAGAGEATAMLMRNRIPFGIVTGWLEGDMVADRQLESWCRAAAIRHSLRHGKAGLLGHPYNGMMDLYANESQIYSKTGLYCDFFEFHEISDAMTQISQSETDEITAYIHKHFNMSGDLTQKDFTFTAQVCAAVLRIIRAKRLSMIPMHYAGKTEDEYGPIVSVLNLVFSILISNGIPCTVEGDIRTAVAMLILKELAGSAMMAELYAMDFEDNTVIIGHSGSSDLCLTDQKPVLRTSNVFHGKSGKGVMTQFQFKNGPVTMISLVEDADGALRVIVAQGEAVAGNILQLGDTNARIKFPLPTREFVDLWLCQGPSHHGALCLGAVADEVRLAALTLGFEYIRIC